MRRTVLAVLLVLLLGACAHQPAHVGAVPPRDDTAWVFEHSDVPLDPGFRFGRLANGMRFVVRSNATPRGTALVRMEVAAGSLDETDAERGYAHFVEHMAFNGSTRVPEGEMVRLLERDGLAFGADTNAATDFEQTTFSLNLPRADPALLDTALMLMRETAGALTFDPQAVARERGVVLAELRDRNTYQWRNTLDDAAFVNPAARYVRRFPIGTAQSLGAATADALRGFWRREYVPGKVTVIVVGDFPAEAMEQAIRAQFADWQPAPDPSTTRLDAGPVLRRDAGRTRVYIDPALSERIVATRSGIWLDEPDTIAQRRENLLSAIGYAIVNRRLQRLQRRPDPPFRAAGFGTGDVFEAGRATRLIVDTPDGRWRRGLFAAVEEYRRALATGFTASEVAEQVANIRTGAQNAARGAATRSNGALAATVFALLRERLVPSEPQGALTRLEAFIPQITPNAVLKALRREAVPLKDPLLRFSGRTAPAGGADALRRAWREAIRQRPADEVAGAADAFGYTDFGPPGAVAQDAAGPLGIRRLRFANGVMLNLKRTGIERDRVLVSVALDGGERLDTRADPLATEMFDALAAGGLGKHSEDALQTILAGHTVATSLRAGSDTFAGQAATTPGDLLLQLQVFAAAVTDPGYRPEGEALYRLQINNFFARKDATPASALATALGGILSDRDPRFMLQRREDYQRLSYARLKAAIADRLSHGAIEIGIVGDFDEAAAIAAVARTFGALPQREAAFRSFADQPPRPFTADRSARTVRHTGPADQALERFTWPTRDDADPVETLRLQLLEKVVRIELVENLREALGKAYSPAAASAPSRVWTGYGTFGIAAPVDVADVAATRAAILATVRDLSARPVAADTLLRGRAPLLELYDNGLKTNAGWLSLVDRAQSEADRIDRYLAGKARLQAMTAQDVQATARRYLDPAEAVEVTVLPATGAPASSAPARTPAP